MSEYAFKVGEIIKIPDEFLNVKCLCGGKLPYIDNKELQLLYRNTDSNTDSCKELRKIIKPLKPYCVEKGFMKSQELSNYSKTMLKKYLTDNEEWDFNESQINALKEGDIGNIGFEYGKRRPQLEFETLHLLHKDVPTDNLRFLWVKDQEGNYSIDPEAIEYIAYLLCYLFRINTIEEINKAFTYSKGLFGYLEYETLQIVIKYIVVKADTNIKDFDTTIQPEMHGTPLSSNACCILNNGYLTPHKINHGDNWCGVKKDDDKGRVYTTSSFKKAFMYSNSKKHFRKITGDIVITKSKMLEKDVKRICLQDWEESDRKNHEIWKDYKAIVATNRGQIHNFETIFNRDYPTVEAIMGILPSAVNPSFTRKLNNNVWGYPGSMIKVPSETLQPWMQAIVDAEIKRFNINKKSNTISENNIVCHYNIDNAIRKNRKRKYEEELDKSLLTLEKLKRQKVFPVDIVNHTSTIFSKFEQINPNDIAYYSQEYMYYMSHSEAYSSYKDKFSVNEIITLHKSFKPLKLWIDCGFKLKGKYKIVGIYSEGYGRPKQAYIIPVNFKDDMQKVKYIDTVQKIYDKTPIMTKWIKVDEIPALKVKLSDCYKDVQ